jgi:putative transposase
MIKRLQESFTLNLIFHVFQVHSSSYYDWYNRPKLPPLKKAKELSVVKAIHEESNGSAGARTISTIAFHRGLSISRYRAGRIMKALGL